MKTLTVYKPYEDRFDVSSPFNVFDRDFYRAFQPLTEMGRYFDRFFGNGRVGQSDAQVRIPAVDVVDTGTGYTLEAELPGFAMEDVSVNLDAGVVTIESKKEIEKKEEEKSADNKNYCLRERCGCAFRRSFKLPENADPEAINASFKNGLLTLNIGKRSEAQKKSIQIESAS